MAVVQYDQEEATKAASGQRFTVKPEGKYTLRVESFEMKPPKEQGKYPTLVCKCTILWASHGQNLGETVTRRFNFHPKSVPYNLIPFLKAAGVPHRMQNGQLDFDENQLPGATTTCECRHEKGDRQVFENWENDEAINQQGVAPPPQQFAPVQQPMQQAWQQPMPVQQPAYQQPMQGSYQQPAYQAPVQQPMPPQGGWAPPQNGTGAPAMPVQGQPPQWMQPGHVAGQGQPPPRGNG